MDAQETGVSIGKAMGLGYSTLRINFTVKNPRIHEKREFTFMGDGYGGGIGVPLPLDIMFTVGKGDGVIKNIHESVDVWRHFVGPAKVEFGTDGEPLLDYSYYRFSEHDLSVQLKMPTQIQAPQVNIKFFEVRVRAGRLR